MRRSVQRRLVCLIVTKGLEMADGPPTVHNERARAVPPLIVLDQGDETVMRIWAMTIQCEPKQALLPFDIIERVMTSLIVLDQDDETVARIQAMMIRHGLNRATSHLDDFDTTVVQALKVVVPEKAATADGTDPTSVTPGPLTFIAVKLPACLNRKAQL